MPRRVLKRYALLMVKFLHGRIIWTVFPVAWLHSACLARKDFCRAVLLLPGRLGMMLFLA